MLIVDNIKQVSEEWFRLKAGVVSGTGFAKVLAKGKGNAMAKTRLDYLYQLATERITGKSADETPNMRWMQHGKENEAQARSIYQIQNCIAVDEVAFIYLNEHKRIGVSPDGLVGDQGMVEIKCVKLSTHVGYLLKNRLPPEYKSQVQGQLWVADRQWCDFCSYSEHSHIELMTVRVWRDEEYIDRLAEEVSVFLSELTVMETKLRKVPA